MVFEIETLSTQKTPNKRKTNNPNPIHLTFHLHSFYLTLHSQYLITKLNSLFPAVFPLLSIYIISRQCTYIYTYNVAKKGKKNTISALTL